MKILVLTCNTGGGHTSCANYIKEEATINKIPCEVVNYLELIGDKTAKIVEKLYLDSTHGNGTVFKGVYKIGEIYNKSSIKSPVYLLNKMVAPKIYEYIVNNGYDLIICTHLFPSMALTEIKKEHQVNFINVATDYECIPFWNETTPDDFIIPSKKLVNNFTAKGLLKKILIPLGIPVSTNFKKIDSKIKLPKDKEIVLITSGSMGFGKMTELIKRLLSEFPDVYFIVICGNNNKLKEELDKIDNPNLQVVGYTKSMSTYIRLSKIIITKPGGLTTSEIATIHKPFIHMMPIPGVENYNANFFANNKMSLKATNIEEVIFNLRCLLNDEKMQEKMKNSQKKLINENSAADLISYIKKKYQK